MTKTIIEESKWYRGKTQRGSQLLREDGQMCCLGFDCLRRGFSPAEILNIGTPSRIDCRIDDPRIKGLVEPSITDSTFKWTAIIVSKIIEVNDDHTITDEERKRKLTELFAQLDTEVVFVP